jgi:glycosyltransferase 2 family protein
LIRLLLRLAVAAAVLAAVATRVELGAVRDALVATPPGAIVVAMLASLAGNVIIAFRLQALLASQGIAVRAQQTLAINLAAFFYNLFLPVGGVGVAAVRLQHLSRRSGGPLPTGGRFTAALTAMVCDRLAAIAALGLVGVVCWFLDPHPKPVGGMIVLLGGVSAMAFMLVPRAIPADARRLARELQAEGVGTWWGAGLSRVGQALGSVARLSPATLARLLVMSVLAQMPGTLVFAVLGQGLGLPVSFVSMGWIRSVVVLLTVLPISIGGVGVREGALVFVLQMFGVSAADALALSILVFAATILAPGLAGGVLEALRWLRGTSDPLHRDAAHM